MHRLKILTQKEYDELSTICNILSPKLSAYINYLRK